MVVVVVVLVVVVVVLVVVIVRLFPLFRRFPNDGFLDRRTDGCKSVFRHRRSFQILHPILHQK